METKAKSVKGLPKKVLDLFPKWSYQCPKCGKEYDNVVQTCLQCGDNYEELSWRVPPRFLKNYDTMSEYAHKVLAPKLNSEQRCLLFQYFTVLFSDGFESGDFSQWDATQNDVSPEMDNPHHGSYNLEASANYSYARVTKYFDETDPVYVRAYIKFTTLPPYNDEHIRVIELRSPNYYADAAIKKSGDDIYWYIHTGEGQYLEATASNPTTGYYYCVELKRSNYDNNAQLWVDGELKVTASSLNITEGVSYVRVGIVYCTCNTTVLADCVVISDSPIGPEDEEEPPASVEADFETGDTSEFDDTPSSSGAVTASSVVAHHGTYSCKCDVNADGNAYAEGYFDIAEQQPIYCRGYFRFNQLPETNKDYTIICFENTSGPTTVGYVQLIDDNGTTKWKMRRDTGNPTYSTSTTNIPEPNKWVSVEFAHGENLTKLWVNGDELLTHTDASNQTIDKIHVGACASDIDADDTLEIHLDCVVINDECIGPEALDLEVSNLTVNKILKPYGLVEINTVMPLLEVDPFIGTDEIYDMCFDDNFNDPHKNAGVTGILTFKDSPENPEDPEPFTSLFGLTFGGETANAPALCTTHHLVVRKDFMARGVLKSYEGILVLHGGHAGWAPTENPLIWLAEGGAYGEKNTLEIRVVTDKGANPPDPEDPPEWGYGGLACGNLNATKLEIKSTNNVFAVTAGDNGEGQHTYLIPENPSIDAGLGLGTADFPFEWVDAKTVFTNGINVLSGDLTLHPTIVFNGGIKSSFNPVTDDAYGLGSGSHAWQGLVAYTVYADDYYSKTGGNATFHGDVTGSANYANTAGYATTAGSAPPTSHSDHTALAIGGVTVFNSSRQLASLNGVATHFNPTVDDTYALGSGGARWTGITVMDIYYADLHDSWDAFEDFEILKTFEPITVTDRKGKLRSVIDPQALTIFKPDEDDTEGMVDLQKISGFQLSAMKRLVYKLEEIEERLTHLEVNQ